MGVLVIQPLKQRMPRRRVRGVTLIELLVALVIGLLLAVAGSAVYLYSKQSYNAVTETSQMEENGRFALNLLARHIQSGGFVMINPLAQAPQAALPEKITGCDFGFVNAKNASNAADVACRASTPAGERRSSSISTTFETDAPSLSGARFQGFNCVGNNADASIVTTDAGSYTRYQATSRFFISTETVAIANGGTTTMGQLSCVAENPSSSSFDASQPLIPGIEQISATYLVPTIQTVSGEIPRLAQTPLDAAAVTAANRWTEVMAVNLCVLTKSIQPVGNDTGTAYTDCFGAAIVATPAESYRIFRTTVNLRNRTAAP
jgi:type IV pilus assembly protein PilW